MKLLEKSSTSPSTTKSIETRSLQYGSSTIQFELEYSSRKTLGIEVNPDTSVLVKAPIDAPMDSIERIVTKRAAWITKQQRQFAKYAPTLPAAEYVAGEGYRYLGRQYRLKLIEVSDVELVRLWRGRLEVYTCDSNNRHQIEKLVQRWYRERAALVYRERYKICIRLVAPYGIEDRGGFELRTMSKRWGSCTKAGRILLNPLLVSASKDCIDYVLVHELCHTLIHNHSPDFYRLLESIVPDWKTRRDSLNMRIELRAMSPN